MDLHSLNVWTHVGAGAAGLAVGLVPLLTAKGGRLHRWTGRVFVAIAAVSLGTAFIANVLFDPPAALIAASLAATYVELACAATA